MARKAAIQQKKQDDCNARLNAVGSPDAIADAFQRRANADLCGANPDITVEEAQHPTLDLSKAQPVPPGAVIGPNLQGSKSARQPVRPKTIEGTITKDAVVYGENLPGGPGGEVLGKVESGTRVRVIRLDSIYGNVQVRTPSGVTGWLSSDSINY
jgi:hypothetical protein